MSHTSVMQQLITNVDLFCQIAAKNGHSVKQAEKGKTFSVSHWNVNAVNNAIASVKLNDWRYPLAITEKGEVLYDHFGSAPQSMQTFRDQMQEYNQELITKNIDYTALSNWTTKKVANGDVVIELEY